MNALEAFAACRTPAMIRRTMILADNRLVPEEVVALHEGRAALPALALPWIETLHRALVAAGPPARFARDVVAPDVTLLRAAGTPRALLVVFCGQVPRPMLPLALFLQHMPPRCDVAMLWDPDRCMYLRGLRGFAEDPASLAARLATALGVARYPALRCLGSSSGGLAGLAMGVLMGASQAVALGGMHPASGNAAAAPEAGLDLGALDDALRGVARDATRLVCAFGADCAPDIARFARLRESLPEAIALPVAGVSEHNILLRLSRRGDLARFLDGVAFGAFEAGTWR